MNNASIINKSLESLKKARAKNAVNEILFTDPARQDYQHEFLFFIKPEITKISDSGKLAAILDLTLDKIFQFRLHIQEIRLLTASYLEKYDIMAQHYGVINAMSRQPLQHFSNDAKAKFLEIFGKKPEDTKLLGSLQFLRNYPAFSADSLEHLWQNSRSVKLAGGTYCARVMFQGNEVYLINGFHPNQLIHFTSQGRCILAFTLTGNLDWSVARNQFIGKTNPADAENGSLRNELLVKKQQFGLNEVSAGLNGFHLSAGPVEGLVELMRYCSDFVSGDVKKPADYMFGRQLIAQFTPDEMARICSNQAVVHRGKQITPFDLTEEKNSRDALVLLKESEI